MYFAVIEIDEEFLKLWIFVETLCHLTLLILKELNIFSSYNHVSSKLQHPANCPTTEVGQPFTFSAISATLSTAKLRHAPSK